MKRAWLFPDHCPGELFSGYDSIDYRDTIIAIDAGLEFLHQKGIMPNLIIGDFDSLSPDLLKAYADVPLQSFPSIKNETDSELALDWCLKNDIREIIICNDLEGRFDHALALIQNMLKAHRCNTSCRIESERQCAFFLASHTSLPSLNGATLSLLSWGEKAIFGFSAGLAYPLNGLELRDTLSRGLSNIITSDECSIKLVSGTVLAIITK
ncbi:MAG: thiamine diphosphokinase [Candidatus Cloacimonadaceae bacterium]|nr:thiamine diphosphokinase [Candidatus Cloacimonadaceae bacterium]MDP3114974.1 thiamine diphosphokinase [Candidatus Cloacimonadaceae bacterium]